MASIKGSSTVGDRTSTATLGFTELSDVEVERLETDFERRLRLRREGIEGSDAIAESFVEQQRIAQENLGLLDAQQDKNQQRLRADAARALASQITGQTATSGAALASGRQTALDVGLASTELSDRHLAQRGKAAGEIAALGTEAKQAAHEATIFEVEQGDLSTDRGGQKAEIESQISVIIENNTGTFGDNPEEAEAAVLRLKGLYDDPEIHAYIDRRAAEVRRQIEEGEGLLDAAGDAAGGAGDLLGGAGVEDLLAPTVTGPIKVGKKIGEGVKSLFS